jgi:hypothetical protein
MMFTSSFVSFCYMILLLFHCCCGSVGANEVPLSAFSSSPVYLRGMGGISTTTAIASLFLRLFAAAVAVESLLGDRELVDLWCNIGQNLLCLLVECELSSNQVSQVAKRLRLNNDKLT